MRILVHDYAGHPFQVQLSRQLARRGHQVRHAYCASTLTPQGSMVVRDDDPDTLEFCRLDLGEMIPKFGYWKRFRLEHRYGRLIEDAFNEFRPDVVLSGNTPTLPQYHLTRLCKRNGVRHVFWVQDIYGLAAYKLLKRRLPVVGHAVGQFFVHLDKKTARWSDALVVITKDFVPVFSRWGIDEDRIHVIHNWSVLEELPTKPRDNAWASEQQLGSGPRVVYTGTLAMKHNPALLLELAAALDRRGSGEMVVVSQGPGADWLQREVEARGVKSLRCLGFQPFEAMAEVLGSSDLLVAILEPDAGVFSVPSKVLSYLCAGRAILGAMPLENLSARIIADQGAGAVVPPDDVQGFIREAEALLDSPERQQACGRAARAYAEEHFDIETITTRFEEALKP